MTKPARSQHLLYLMLRAQQLAKQEKSSDGGYVMVVVSILTVMIFSLLAAYLMLTNLSRSSTNAYVEGNSTFYAAESGLNQRANAIRQRFLDYDTPTGVSPGVVAGELAGPANMAACLKDPTAGSGDYACKKLELNYRQGLNTTVSTGADGKSLSATDHLDNVPYTAYTFASDRTIYTDPIRKIPQVTLVPAGQAFAGLNAQEYRYTIYSMATSKQPKDLDAKALTVLEMTFKSRAIALFQFAAFYDGDLEMNSTSQMNINGRVHTNGNFYAQATPVAAKKKNTDVANTRLLGPLTVAGRIYNRVDASTVQRFGDTEVLISGNPDNPTDPLNDYEFFPTYNAGRITPLTATEIAEFKGKVLDGATGASKLKLPAVGFLRKRDKDNKISDYYGKADLRLEMLPKRVTDGIPFNFTAIKEGGTGVSCAGFDVSSNRQGTNLKCTRLNEGQLRSLQQPVLVKVLSDAERKYCPGVTLTKNYNSSSGGSEKKLRALQVAIAAQNTPVTWSQLNKTLSDPVNVRINAIASILESSSSGSDTPVQIATKEGACFRPAPVQVLKGSGTANPNYNWQSSYYDRRENRWIGMLQTNITSLTLWNRDGLYVNRDNNFTTNDLPTATSAEVAAAFNSGNASTTYDTNGLLFNRAAANATAPVGSFRQLGLGASDTTEGGLTLHATLNDDLGDGTTIDIDPVDNLRKYPEGKTNGSYGFAITDGADLPSSFTVATELPLYVQGDFNTFGGDAVRQPASLVGDVITVLSNSCNDGNQINCGITTGQNVATATTVNAGFLSHTDLSSGNVGTSSFGSGFKDYSGGLNNYMRMAENWATIPFTYQGSFVSLGIPEEFSGNYLSGGSGGYYNVPIRNFGYDTNFNAFDRLPPLTPRVIYLQQETFKRSYN
jgi:hypothetical protein